jgi:hypothetical protein
MKITFWIFQIILLPLILNGQALIYNNPNNLRTGFYKDFNEFKYNNPSTPFNFNDYIISSRQRGYGFFNLTGSVKYFTINITRDNASFILNAFGYCDGHYIYLHMGNSSFLTKADFVRIDYLGRYSYFESVLTNRYVIPTYYGVSASSLNSSFCRQVMDITDGNVITLNKLNLRDLIRSDKELSNEFDNEDHKNEKLKEYIIKYSEKHKDEYCASIVDDIDSLIYKLNSDSTYEDYYNRILSYASDPSFISIELRQDQYSNGRLNFIGLKAKHKKGANADYFYKIGTWRFFYKNGQLKELIDFNLKEEKNGRYQLYDEEGNLLEDKRFEQNKEVF